jgi:hypothetical protein
MMLKRTFAMILAVAFAAVSFGLQTSRAEGADAAVEKARAAVSKAGVGPKARVEVRLLDNTKLKGYVSEAGADSFTLTDAETGAARHLAYSDVAQIQKRGGGLSTTTKALIWGGVAAGAAVTLYVVRGAFCDGQC